MLVGYRDTKVRLTDFDKQMIPYVIGETLSFIDSVGQNFVLKVIKDSLSRWMESEDYYEFRQVYLQSEDNNLFISLLVVAPSDMSTKKCRKHPVRDKMLVKKDPFANSVPLGTQCFPYIVSLTGHLSTACVLFLPILCPYGTIHYRQFANDTTLARWFIITTTLFYNKTYGILQLDYKDKVLFTINN